VCSWSTFGAWMNHEQTWIHKTHHDPDLEEATTFPFIVFFVLGHGVAPKYHFVLGLPTLEQHDLNYDYAQFFDYL